MTLPAWSNGSDALVRAYDRPDKRSITKVFESMTELVNLEIWGEPKTWSDFLEDPALVHTICRALTSRPLASLRHLRIEDCHVTSVMTDMIKAHKLFTLSMSGAEKRYSAQSFLPLSSLVTILEIARDMPLVGLLDIWDFATWDLLPEDIRITDPMEYNWKELDEFIKKVKDLRTWGELSVTYEDNEVEGGLWGDEIFTSGEESPQFSDAEPEGQENVVFNTIV
jgi:hypothetical protein